MVRGGFMMFDSSVVIGVGACRVSSEVIDGESF